MAGGTPILGNPHLIINTCGYLFKDDGSLWCPLEVGPPGPLENTVGKRLRPPTSTVSTKVSSQWRIATLQGRRTKRYFHVPGLFRDCDTRGLRNSQRMLNLCWRTSLLCWIRRLVPEINWILKHWQIAAMFLLLSYFHTKSRFLCSFHASQTT